MLAYVSSEYGSINSRQLYVLDMASDLRVSIGQIEVNLGLPVWSVDGRLLFYSNRGANYEIYMWDGVTLTNVSRSPADDFSPLWWTP
jgi:Tol biopolymer transport system component